jgi:hypothetical protein
MEDARKEGGRWFCSPSCLMQGSSGRWKKPERSKPARVMRRTVKWTLIVLGLLMAALIVGAVLGLGNKSKGGNAPTSGPGSRSDPIAIGRAADIGAGWRLKVLHVTPNADSLVAHAVNGTKPPKGARDFLIKLAVTYLGGGKGDLQSLVTNGLTVMGVHNASYNLIQNPCGEFMRERFDLAQVGSVFSGQTARGNVCFQIAANDAKTLMLYPGYSKDATALFGNLPKLNKVWFALHRHRS